MNVVHVLLRHVGDYLQMFKRRPKSLIALLSELESTISALTQLANFFQEHAGSMRKDLMLRTSLVVAQLAQVTANIAEVLKKMQPSMVTSMRLKWPFYEKEMEAQLQRVHCT
jgi:hypothetical protein